MPRRGATASGKGATLALDGDRVAAVKGRLTPGAVSPETVWPGHPTAPPTVVPCGEARTADAASAGAPGVRPRRHSRQLEAVRAAPDREWRLLHLRDRLRCVVRARDFAAGGLRGALG